MTPNHVDINVRGNDMFGAYFSESAKLTSVAENELSVFMWRPVAEGARLELSRCDKGSSWIKGRIVRITLHLNGAQTVQVKVHSPISEAISFWDIAAG